MKGLCIQGDVKNANQRIYPVNEISNAVKSLKEQIGGGYSVLGELDHPDDLKINLDRVSHVITDVWMEGANGYGKLKILPTPMGTLVETMLGAGVKLGVSSRGSGNVNESNGHVSDFEIVTVDVVAQPSAPDAYPTAIYEGLLNMEGGSKLLEMASDARESITAQRFLKSGILQLIKDLKLQEILMLDAMKPLLDSELINEDTRIAIQEEWDAKLTETREEVRTELREEFAQRYEHDKQTMVEALDRMVSESLEVEIQEVVAEKEQLAEDRVKFNTKMTENSNKFNKFMVTKLSEEINDLRKDRQVQTEGMVKLENFVVKALAREINEFAQDKKEVIETKVKLVAEAKTKLNALKTKFVKENAKKVGSVITKRLNTELSQLQEDVKVARENNFGRRIFEAFSTEFTGTHLNENAVIRKLNAKITARDSKLEEAKETIKKAKVLVESKNAEVKTIKESNVRAKTMDELLSPLQEDKATVMQNLLENVQTSRLQHTFEKYLPAVLSNKSVGSDVKRKKALTESKTTVTGNKKETKELYQDSIDNIVDIKRLAGL